MTEKETDQKKLERAIQDLKSARARLIVLSVDETSLSFFNDGQLLTITSILETLEVQLVEIRTDIGKEEPERKNPF